MAIYFGHKTVKVIFLGSVRAILVSIFMLQNFMFVYMCLSIKLADIFLGCSEAELMFLGCQKLSWNNPISYVLSAPWVFFSNQSHM